MNLTSSHPFWSVNNGLPANYPSLQRDVSCDAVVIGGGITGALVAIHLAEAGVKTLVLDKRDIGTGSTSASTALLQYEIDVSLRELIKKIGPVAATRSYQLCRDAIRKLEQLAVRCKIDCGFERKPSLFLSRHQREIDEFHEEFQLRRKMGIEVEFYDATAVRARFSFSRPAALFSKVGGQVDPHRLTHGLLAAGKRAGLEVYDRTKMTSLDETCRGVRITTHNGCQITARRAVWVGAAVTALLFDVGNFLIGLYLGNTSVASSFGAAGSLAVLLVWVYFSAQIFLLGAEFTRVYSHGNGSKAAQTGQESVPAGPSRSGGAAAAVDAKSGALPDSGKLIE